MSLCGLCFSLVEGLEKSPALQNLIEAQSSNILVTLEGLIRERLDRHTSNIGVIVCDLLVKGSSNVSLS